MTRELDIPLAMSVLRDLRDARTVHASTLNGGLGTEMRYIQDVSSSDGFTVAMQVTNPIPGLVGVRSAGDPMGSLIVRLNDAHLFVGWLKERRPDLHALWDAITVEQALASSPEWTARQQPREDDNGLWDGTRGRRRV